MRDGGLADNKEEDLHEDKSTEKIRSEEAGRWKNGRKNEKNRKSFTFHLSPFNYFPYLCLSKCYKKVEKIDSLDKKILEIISNNARIPFKDVAAECGISRAAVHQRVQKLIDMGVIVGSGYHVNPASLGYNTCTYVGITLEKGSMYKAVVQELTKIPEVVECHFTTGPYTMLVKLYARDNAHLMELLNDKLQEINGVMSTETLISLRQNIKKELPIGQPQAETAPRMEEDWKSIDD